MRLAILIGSVLAASLQGTVYKTAAGPSGDAQAGQLPASARVVLMSGDRVVTAPITDTGDFSLQAPAGSYLLRVAVHTHLYEDYRVDLSEAEEARVHGTTAGQAWSAVGPRQPLPLQIYPKQTLDYYMPRPSLNLVKMLKNPLVWLGLVMVFSLFGLPKITAMLDPDGVEEMQALKEVKQKQRQEEHQLRRQQEVDEGREPIVNPVQRMQNFDVSGWLAGKK